MLVIAAMFGSAISHSSAICPRPRIAISSTSACVSRRGTQHRQWQADLGVVVLRAGMDAQGQDRVADVLDRRLAHRPRDPDDPASQLAPPGPSERLQRGERIRRGQHPAATVFRPTLGGRARAWSARAPPRPRRPRLRPRAPARRTRPRRRARPAGRRTGPLRRSCARVDDCPLGPPARAGDRDLGAGRGGDALWRQLDHAPGRSHMRSGLGRHTPDPLRSLRSSSLATSRSSNGIFRPPANSCPCSWPLPAMTTVSPGPAAPSASAIAARRSGSTLTPGCVVDSGQDLGDDRLRLLRARVVGGDHAGVRESSARSPPSGAASHGRDPRRSRRPRSAVPRSACAPPSSALSSESGVWA